VTAVTCVGVGALAGPVAFAAEFQWPLSEINFSESVHLGIGWGSAGAVLATVVLALTDRKYLWIKALAAILATWVIAFVRIWWLVVSSLG